MSIIYDKAVPSLAHSKTAVRRATPTVLPSPNNALPLISGTKKALRRSTAMTRSLEFDHRTMAESLAINPTLPNSVDTLAQHREHIIDNTAIICLPLPSKPTSIQSVDSKVSKTTFLSLPTELRVIIYENLIEMALTYYDRIATFGITNNGTLFPCNLRRSSWLGSMILTCKSISHDFLTHLWSTSFLSIQIDNELKIQTKISDLHNHIQKLCRFRRFRFNIETRIGSCLPSVKNKVQVRAQIRRDWVALSNVLTEDLNIKEVRINWRFWPILEHAEVDRKKMLEEQNPILSCSKSCLKSLPFAADSGSDIRVRFHGSLIDVNLLWISKSVGDAGERSDWHEKEALWTTFSKWNGGRTQSLW